MMRNSCLVQAQGIRSPVENTKHHLARFAGLGKSTYGARLGRSGMKAKGPSADSVRFLFIEASSNNGLRANPREGTRRVSTDGVGFFFAPGFRPADQFHSRQHSRTATGSFGFLG